MTVADERPSLCIDRDWLWSMQRQGWRRRQGMGICESCSGNIEEEAKGGVEEARHRASVDQATWTGMWHDQRADRLTTVASVCAWVWSNIDSCSQAMIANESSWSVMMLCWYSRGGGIRSTLWRICG